MSNGIRTRDGGAFDFEDGLRVKGYLLDGNEGTKAIAFLKAAGDASPTLLYDWIMETITTINDIVTNGVGGSATAPDQPTTDNSGSTANTKFVQALLTEKLLDLVGTAPTSLNTLAEIAAAINNDPLYYQTVQNALAGKASLADLQGSLASFAMASGGADAITASFTPAITATTQNLFVRVRASAANTTTTPTFSPNSGTVAFKVIVKGANQPLEIGDIAGAGHWLNLKYDQVFDKWVLLNPAFPVSLQYATNAQAIAGTSTNTLVTPAALKATLALITGSAPAALDSFVELAQALNNDANFATTVLTALATKAPLDNANLTGAPTAPTPIATDSSTRLATTAFVAAAISAALATVSITDATTATKGKVRLATSAEAIAGTDQATAVTPFALKAALADFASSQYTAPNAPTLTGNASAIVGQTYVLNATATATQSGATISSFDISINGGAAQTVTATSGAATYNWTAAGTVGSSVTITVTAKDSNNRVSSASTKTITLSTVTINTPTVSSPVAGATGVSITPTITTSAFATTGGSDTHQKTDWVVKDSGGATVWSSLADTTNKTSITVPANTLVNSGVYTINVTYYGATYGASAVGTSTFTVAVPSKTAPSVSVQSTVVGNKSYNVALSATPSAPATSIAKFVVTVNGGTAQNVTASSNTGTYVLTVPFGTAGNTPYVISAYAVDNVGERTLSATATATCTTINAPTVTYPTAGATGVSLTPTFACANISTTGGTDTLKTTSWAILDAAGANTLWSDPSDNVNLLSKTIPAGVLSATTTYKLRVVHEGTITGLSTATDVSFTTGTALVGPTLTGATSVYIGASYSLSLSASPVAPATSITSFSVSVNGGAATTVTASSNAGTFTYPGSSTAGLANNASVSFAVSYTDNLGNVSSTTSKTITAYTPYVATPTITSPAADATGVSVAPTLTAAAFSVVGGTDTHTKTDWEIYNGGTLVWSSIGNTTNLTSITVPNGTLPNAAYLDIHVKFYGATYGVSLTYGISSFTTTPQATGPTISAGTVVGQGASLPLTLTGNVMAPATSIAKFQVSVDGGAYTDIAAASNIGTFTLTAAQTAAKAAGAGFNLNFKAIDNTGAVSTITGRNVTVAAVNAPAVTSPANGATAVSVAPTLTSQAFSVTGGTDTHLKSDWEVRTAANGGGTLVWSSMSDSTNRTSIALPAATLANATTYYARCKHYGTTYGAGAWGADSSFTTAASAAAPTLTGASSSYIGSAYTLSISATPVSPATSITSFAVSVDGTAVGTLTASSNAATYTWPAASSAGKANGASTVFTVTATDNTGAVSTVATKTISMIAPTVNAPTISAPAAGATGIGLGPTLTASAFAVTGGTDTHLNTDWVIKDSTNTTVVWQSLANTANKTTITVPANTLAYNTTYKLNVTYRGTTYGASTTTTISFTTVAQAAAPTLTGNSYHEVGTYYNLAFSATPVAPATSIAKFTVVVNGGTAFDVTASGNAGNTSVHHASSDVTGVIPPATYNITVTATDNTGAVSAVSTKTVQRSKVNVPTLSGVTNGATGVSVTPTITTSAFSVTGETDTHASTTWRIYTGPGRTGTLVHANNTSTTDKTSYTIPAGVLSGGTLYYLSVAHNGVKYIAGSDWAEISFTTANPAGLTWTTSNPGIGMPWGVEYAYGKYLVSGFRTDGSNYYPGEVAYSTDLSSWSKVTLPSASHGSDMIYDGNRLILGCPSPDSSGAGQIATSTNGTTWSLQAGWTQGSFYGTFATDGVVLVASSFRDGKKLGYSSDHGVTWNYINMFTRRTSEDYAVQMTGFAYSATLDLFVCAGGTTSYPITWTSPDGITWTENANMDNSGGQLSSVCYGNSKFVAVGGGAWWGPSQTAGIIYTSTNGTTWTKQTFSGGGLTSVCWTGSLFVAVGYTTAGADTAGAIWTSPDGVTWTQRTVTAGALQKVKYVNGKVIAVGLSTSGSGSIVCIS